MHIKAPNTHTHINTRTHTNTHYFEDVFKVTGDDYTHKIFAGKKKTTQNKNKPSRTVHSQLVLYSFFDAGTLSNGRNRVEE